MNAPSSPPRYSWTQPYCDDCWQAAYPEGRQPYRMRDEFRETETCCGCGTATRSGIYIRTDPTAVTHPTRRKEQ